MNDEDLALLDANEVIDLVRDLEARIRHLESELKTSRAEMERFAEHCTNCETWLWQNLPFKGQRQS